MESIENTNKYNHYVSAITPRRGQGWVQFKVHLPIFNILNGLDFHITYLLNTRVLTADFQIGLSLITHPYPSKGGE